MVYKLFNSFEKIFICLLSFSVIIGLAEGEILADAEVQKSALTILVNCVCGPIERVGHI